MRNVIKGFQVGKSAAPKFHAVKMNKDFKAYHGGGMVKMEKPQVAKRAPKLPSRKSWNNL